MLKENITAFIQSCGGGLSASKYSEIVSCGWYSTESHDEYTDLHTDLLYCGDHPTGKSFDVRLSIVWPENSFYMVFGVNKGEGFDELATINYGEIGNALWGELAVAVARDTTGQLKAICESCRHTKADMVQRLTDLQQALC